MDIFGPLYVKLGGGTVKHWTLVVPANLLGHTCDSSRVGPLNGHRWFYNVFLITSFINCRGKVVQLRCERGTTWPPRDVQPITPFHFIMHRKTICLPPAWSFKRTEQFHRRKWRKVKFLADVLWKSWLREYLPLLQVREKGCRALPNFKPNALVLLVDENASRGRWNLGRVAQMLRLPETYYDVLFMMLDLQP